MLGFEYSENFDKMLDNGGGIGGVEHCGYLREMPNLVDEEESPPELLFDDRKIVIGGEVDDADADDDDDMDRCSSSSNSSSIGNNSDEEQHHNSDDKEEEEEVQSSSCKYNSNNGGGANFDDAIQALEDALPIRFSFVPLLSTLVFLIVDDLIFNLFQNMTLFMYLI